MSSPPAPPPPADPVKTAEAQGEMNKATAVAQTGLNSTDQVTPQGSLSYSQSGTWADGTPHFTAKQTLSPEQQAIYDQSTGNQLKLGNVAGGQIDRVSDILSKPVDLSGAPALPTFNGDTSAIEGRIDELARARLDPMLATKRAALENQLANQGVTSGSEAWQHSMDQLGRDENDARNQLLLTGRGQAFNELGTTYGYNMQGHQQGVQDILAQRETPINEITALMSGSQVSKPTYVSAPQSSIAPVDYTGLVTHADDINQKNYGTQVAQQNAMMGGLFGLGGAGLQAGASLMKPSPMMFFSERALKADAERIGEDPRGFGIYRFRYLWDEPGTTRTGYMVDEVERVRPDAIVRTPGAFAMIDYGALAHG
jgi:hypothetical protein